MKETNKEWKKQRKKEKQKERQKERKKHQKEKKQVKQQTKKTIQPTNQLTKQVKSLDPNRSTKPTRRLPRWLRLAGKSPSLGPGGRVAGFGMDGAGVRSFYVCFFGLNGLFLVGLYFLKCFLGVFLFWPICWLFCLIVVFSLVRCWMLWLWLLVGGFWLYLRCRWNCWFYTCSAVSFRWLLKLALIHLL